MEEPFVMADRRQQQIMRTSADMEACRGRLLLHKPVAYYPAVRVLHFEVQNAALHLLGRGVLVPAKDLTKGLSVRVLHTRQALV